MEAKTFSDELWSQWLAAVQDPQTKTVLLGAWGPAKPTTSQWRDATKVMKATKVTVAVVTEDRHNAALAKKASWIGAKVESFRWDTHLYDPFVFLGFDLATRKEMKPRVFGLRDYFGPLGEGSSAAGPSAPASRSSTPASRPSAAPSRSSTPASRPSAPGAKERKMPAWMLERDTLGERGVRVGDSADSSKSKSKSKSKADAGLGAEFKASRDAVFRSSSDIQAKLAEVQAKLRARNLEMQRSRS